MTEQTHAPDGEIPPQVDVVIVGAGFAGMYQLKRLRDLGLRCIVIEAGDDVGGTWYWNRYPGARCDIETIHYSYSFDPQLEQEWTWKERYAAQPELYAYARHVADRFDLRTDIRFGRRVQQLRFAEDAGEWTTTLTDGTAVRSRFVVLAVGCLSAAQTPAIEGLESFAGDVLHTSTWPHEPVDFRGKRVAVVGTGSSGIQTITTIARDVERLFVFQRTPNFSVPAHNRPITAEEMDAVKARYRQIREADRMSRGGRAPARVPRMYAELSAAEVEQELDQRWQDGGLAFGASFADTLVSSTANDAAADYVRRRIGEIVVDDEVAKQLQPTNFPLGTKRLCVDTGYYECFNLPHVTLVPLPETGIDEVTDSAVVVSGVPHEVEVIIMATGFDAMTGPILRIDIENGGRRLADKWSDGPRAYLGVMTEGFPNLFLVTGPGSPSVLSNMLVSIEQHVELITGLIEQALQRQARIDVSAEAERAWAETVNDAANATLMPQANSWYLGANIPGKPRMFMPFVGGVDTFRIACDRVVADDFAGFTFA